MKKYLIILLLVISTQMDGQINLTVEGVDYTMTTHNGYEIARANPTNLIFRYNRITSAMDDGFLLMAGDNDYGVSTSTNLNGAQIYGSRFIVTNTTPPGSIHGMMVGYNENYDIHHNLVNSYDYGVTHEGGFPDHTSMDNSSGGIYYNIFKDCLYNIVEKGYDGTRIIGNTFSSAVNDYGMFVGIKESDTGGLTAPYPVTKNTVVMNNIFHYRGTSTFPAIIVGGDNDDTEAEMDTVGLVIDYNVYYYENTAGNEPYFVFNNVPKSWTEWRALGYDEHSIIVDPNFIDLIDFVPTARLDYGTPVPGFESGLSVDHVWTVGEVPTYETQGSIWQVGAKLYATPAVGNFYVAPDGDDTYPGTFAQPWATWGKAFNSTAVQPGDIVYFRGGAYSMTSNDLSFPGTPGSGYDITRDGTIADTIKYWAYPDEVPILDCNNIDLASGSNHGINANDVSYVYFKGLTVRNVNQSASGSSTYGWVISGDNLKIENCEVYNTGGRGFFSLGHEIYYINCDSHHNCDSLTPSLPGNDGVGFQNTDLSNEDGTIYYRGCRAWMNGDQGFSAVSVGYLEFDSCWSFNNGLYQGEGHGFKMGSVGVTQPPYGPLKRKYTNNIAAYNRANGWTTNDNTEYLARPMQTYNNLAYHNGYPTGWGGLAAGFVIYNTASVDAEELSRVYRNNIAYLNEDGNTFIPSGALYTHSNNSWDGGATIDASDFEALPATMEAGVDLLMTARTATGGLPSLGGYFQLAEGSDAINAGVDVGIDFIGAAPDLGMFEFDGEGPIVPIETWTPIVVFKTRITKR